jgi:hypothetical protein
MGASRIMLMEPDRREDDGRDQDQPSPGSGRERGGYIELPGNGTVGLPSEPGSWPDYPEDDAEEQEEETDETPNP